MARARNEMWLRLMCAALVEFIYAVATRVWLRAHYSGVELELLVTAARLVCVFLFWLLFRHLLSSRASQPGMARHPLVACSVALMLMVPVLVGRYNLSPLMQVVFVATSIIVAIKEEFLYRGVLQNVLETKGRPLRAVILSNIIFMLYHYGAQPFTIGNLTEIFTAGCILGFIYASSGSLMLVIVLHAIYDAIWSLTPVLTSPLPRSVGSVTLVVAFVLCVVWVTRSNHRFQLTALPCFAQQGRS